MSSYLSRLIERQLSELLSELPAIAIDGAKGVGKTSTAQRFAKSTFRLDDNRVAEAVQARPEELRDAAPPVLLDEWQRLPLVWDVVRRSVDDDRVAGRFILTGSAVPAQTPVHSGAGRIIRLRMRPLSLAERSLVEPTVSLAGLLGGQSEVSGSTSFDLRGYVDEMLRSGFPGLRDGSWRAIRNALDSYVDNIVQRQFAEQGVSVRKPETLRAWLTAYAAATGGTANYTEILDAATAGQPDKPSKDQTLVYRDALADSWLTDEVAPWLPVGSSLPTLTRSPKHFLADPAIAARLLDLSHESLLSGDTPEPLGPQQSTLLGRFFEALVGQSLQVYAAVNEAKLSHLRLKEGKREIDFVISRGRDVVAVEVKLNPTVDGWDVRHLNWLAEKFATYHVTKILITPGPYAYTRSDGVHVIPAVLLGA
ncbi:MAG: DUF4143 domain-containing protein [Propionibacteriaceae bacterium]|jgi:predicted AAA+ superfamily ATPase|nr:DUF4143 domain-containing protein [Propionibacteriaceae bacterium]